MKELNIIVSSVINVDTEPPYIAMWMFTNKTCIEFQAEVVGVNHHFWKFWLLDQELWNLLHREGDPDPDFSNLEPYINKPKFNYAELSLV